MPRLDDGKDAEFAFNRVPGRFYVSKRFPYAGDVDRDQPRASRFANQVFDSNQDVIFENDNGWEVILRETETRQQLKALFFEDSRHVLQLAFSRFSADKKLIKSDYFVLHGDEILDLAAFLALVMSPEMKLAEGEEGTRLSRSVVAKILQDRATKQELYEENRPELLRLLENDPYAPEVVAIARRRAQLETFDRLLNDSDYFSERALSYGSGRRSEERVWQDFFEQNRWIFGSGLTAHFLHSWSPDKLEQSVVGSSIQRAGRRPDGLMRTAAAVSAMVLVEIKIHSTPLLRATEHRPDVFAPSKELVEAVAQCQATIDESMEELAREELLRDTGGFETGELVRLCRPRSLLVIGSLDQFMQNGQVHDARFRSFERFRRSISDPEIVTFDELYERVRLVLSAGESEPVGEADPESPPFEGGF